MEAWANLLSGLVGAIIGGGIAGYCSLHATDKAHTQAKELETKRQKDLMDGLLQGLHDEIETLWDSYTEGIGVFLETLPEGKPLLMYYPVTQEYFSIYVGNAFLIGKIPDAELRKKIVFTYSKSRGLIDSYRLNNDLVQKFEHWDSMFKQTGQEVFKQHALDFLGRLVEYAKQLKKSHAELKIAKSETLRILQKRGVLLDLEK